MHIIQNWRDWNSWNENIYCWEVQFNWFAFFVQFCLKQAQYNCTHHIQKFFLFSTGTRNYLHFDAFFRKIIHKTWMVAYLLARQLLQIHIPSLGILFNFTFIWKQILYFCQFYGGAGGCTCLRTTHASNSPPFSSIIGKGKAKYFCMEMVRVRHFSLGWVI